MPKKILVCSGPHCTFRGADRIFETLKNFFSSDQDVAISHGACNGFCEEGPNVVEDETIIYHHAATKDIGERIEKRSGTPLVKITEETLNLDESFLNP